MELKMQKTMFPQSISFNFDELKVEVTEKAELYKNMVYTEEAIAEAKTDRAKLNKFIKVLDDKKKEVKKQCLEPYNEFESQIKELIGIMSEPVMMIDSQVKSFEQKKKDEKLEAIIEYWESKNTFEWLKFDKILDPKWLNASTSMKKVQEDIEVRLEQVKQHINTLSYLPEFSFEAIEIYKDTLNVNLAISEGQRMADIQKRKLADADEKQKLHEEIQAKMAEMKGKPEPTVAKKETVETENETAFEYENGKTWLRFKALLSVEDAMALNKFFKDRNIKFEAI